MPSWPARSPQPEVYQGFISNIPNWVRAGQAALWTSATWSTANLAVYTPAYSEMPVKLEPWLFNGAAVSGHFDIGIYLPDAEGLPGARLLSSGSVLQAGTEQAQSGLVSAWVQGFFYLACSFDNNTGQVRRVCAPTTNGKGVALGSIFTQAAAFVLPANATPSMSFVAVNVPVIGARII